MGTQIYNAEVKFGASPEPYDSGWGPSHNICVVFDDPSAPKANGDGELNIYKKAGTPDVNYMFTLQKGDKIQLVYNEVEGRKPYYSFVYNRDDLPKPLPPGASTQPVQAISRGNIAIEWSEPDDEFWDIWALALNMESRRLGMAMDAANTLMENKQSIVPYNEDGILRVAISLYMSASKHAKPGLVLAKEEEEGETDMDASLLMLIDDNDMTGSLVNAIVLLSDGFYNESGLKSLLKGFGITSADIVDRDAALNIAHIAWDYSQMVGDGASESIAENAVADKYDLVAF